MKQTKIALLIASVLASTASFADVSVYNQGGTDVAVYGRFDAALDKSEQTKTDLRDGDSRIGLKVSQDLNNGLSALGAVEFRFADADGRFKDPTTHSAYVGLKQEGLGTITLGRQSTTADDLALSKYAYRHENITMQPTKGDRTIKIRTADYDVLGGSLGFGADYTIMGNNSKDESIRSSSVGGGFFYKNTIGDLEYKWNGGYSQTQYNDATIVDSTSVRFNSGLNKYVQKAWMTGVEVKSGDTKVAVDYARSQMDRKTTGYDKKGLYKTDKAQVALKHQFTPDVGGFVAYQYGKHRTLSNEMKYRLDQYTVGFDYKLADNVITYAQVDVAKTKTTAKLYSDKSTDVGGAVGIRLTF